MLAKVLIIITLLVIAYTLGTAFYFLIRDKGEGTRTVRRLTWRIGLSLALFLVIVLAMVTGWIQPGSNGPVRYPAAEQMAPVDP